MKDNKSIKALKKQMAAAVAMVCVAGVALGSSTYAWFISNTKVTAETSNFTASTAYTLLISKGEKGADSEWVTTHPMSETSKNVALQPVSTVGGTGVDKLDFVYDTKWTPDTADGKNYATGFAAAEDTSGKYMVEKFQIKAEQVCDLYLDDATTFTAKNTEMLKTMRLGLVVDDGTNKTTFIYQLDDGTDASGTRGNTTKDSTGADGITQAVNASGTVANIVTTNTNVVKLPLATGSTDTTSMITTTGTADKLYSFAKAGDIVNITAYVWMEGCDYDCTASESAYFNMNKAIGNIEAKLSFGAALAQN